MPAEEHRPCGGPCHEPDGEIAVERRRARRPAGCEARDACDLAGPLRGRRERELRQVHEPGRVPHVPPRAGVVVVVVAVEVEHRVVERVAVVGVRVHDVRPAVADVPVVGRRAGVRRRVRDRAEVVDQLVQRDAGEPAALAEIGEAVRLEVEEGEAELAAAEAVGEARAADVRVDRRPVVVDEGLHRFGGRAAESDRQRPDVHARGVDVAHAGLREANEAEVEVAEGRGAAGERVQVEARRAGRVLPAPPGVHRADVRGDRRGVLREVVDSVGRDRVDDADLVRRRDLQIGHAVRAHLVRAAPGDRGRGRAGRPGEAEHRGSDEHRDREWTKGAHCSAP